MLKRKLKICKTCGLSKVIWKNGECLNCSNFNYKPLKPPKRGLNKKSKDKNNYKEFFNYIYEKTKDSPISFESGKNLGKISTVNMAHILPKSHYKSVSKEPLNVILLSWEEHSRFDELLNNHDFEKLEKEFKSWKRICQRFIVVNTLCKENGILRKALENYVEGYMGDFK